MLLAMAVGLGNILKNFFLVPRPSHPPVWVHTETEKDHGLPSTHTMTAITLPWYFIIFHSYLEPSFTLPSFVFGLAVMWTVSVIMSRLYNGHHTPMDVAVGALLGIGILAFWTFQLRPVVDSIVTSDTLAGVLTIVGTAISILVLHPTPPKIPTPAYPETGLVTGTATGAALGLWSKASHKPLAVYTACRTYFGLPISPLPWTLFEDNFILVCVVRFVIGVAIVAVVRLVIKALSTFLVLQAARMLNRNTKYASKLAFKYSEAEVAVKYITYTAIGFSATYLAHIVFAFAGVYLPLDDAVISTI